MNDELPFFGIYRVAEGTSLMAYRQQLSSRFFSPPRPDGSTALNQLGKAVGIIPHFMNFRKGENFASPLHRHFHLEIIFVTAGTVSYEEDGRNRPVSTGAILFINHTKTHRISGEGPFSYFSIRFIPSAIERMATDEMTIDTLMRFDCFSPFYGVERGDSVLTPFAGESYKRLLVNFLQVNHSFVESKGEPSRLLQGSFQLLLDSLLGAYQKQPHVPGHPDGVRRVIEMLHRDYDRKISMAVLCREAGQGKTALSNAFNLAMGMSIPEYANRLRVAKSKYLLQTTRLPITEIALSTGFYDASHFTREFVKQEDMTPSSFRTSARAK